ncbi:MAG: cyclic-di-AMP-binding protein CbpB [Limosilactobacillus pontis]|uniref:CBS domain-containing protein n=1 Tax=Limosilactobacillus pontis TaxID=35787 RepID=A0A2J6NLK1_9LACO|nr:cyclic-di-AMP-binding protein CbpB [Limosilactobacillus pontis]PMB82194.1 CBS domain-containing protein [Limosilactobacillus pontis]
MIDQHLEQMLLTNKRKFMIPASLVATVNVTNSLDHAFLVLTKDHYAKIVVVDNDNHYRGLISLSMITDHLLDTHKIAINRLQKLVVGDVMQTNAPVITNPFDVEENLHLLIDQSFLTVVDDDQHFRGIVTRRELLKAVNYTVHNFAHFYQVQNK